MNKMKEYAKVAKKTPLGSGQRFAAVAASAGGGEKGKAIAYKAGVKAGSRRTQGSDDDGRHSLTA